MSIPARIVLASTIGLCVFAAPSDKAEAAPLPVYVHMNMKSPSMILEGVLAVRPGQKVVFVNQDNDIHTIIGYNPKSGAAIERVGGSVPAASGKGHIVATYAIKFMHLGQHYYYCSVHAYLKRQPGRGYVPAIRPGVHGFGAPMAGLIIVTTNKTLLAENPKTAYEKILPPSASMTMPH